jgi:hypothetical protein
VDLSILRSGAGHSRQFLLRPPPRLGSVDVSLRLAVRLAPGCKHPSTPILATLRVLENKMRRHYTLAPTHSVMDGTRGGGLGGLLILFTPLIPFMACVYYEI